MSRAGAIALLVLLAPCAPSGAQELGRLFFSPAERDALDARRGDKPAAPPPATTPMPLRIDGYVLRSDGRPAVWVNGAALATGSRKDGLRVTLGAGHPGEVAVAADARRSSVRVKVGGTLDRGSGELRDVIGDGKVTVRR